MISRHSTDVTDTHHSGQAIAMPMNTSAAIAASVRRYPMPEPASGSSPERFQAGDQQLALDVGDVKAKVPAHGLRLAADVLAAS